MKPDTKGEGTQQEPESLGIRLKTLRIYAKHTLREVEEVTGISNAYLSQLENDKIKSPSANVLYKLAEFYGLELDQLMKPVETLYKQQVKPDEEKKTP